MKEYNHTIKRWNINLPDFPKTIYKLGLYDDYEGFRLVFTDSNMKLFKFTFYNPISYRCADEGVRLDSLDLYPLNSNQWCLFKSTESDFIAWMLKEAGGIYEVGQITHYHFATQDDIIEVLSLEDPTIEEL